MKEEEQYQAGIDWATNPSNINKEKIVEKDKQKEIDKTRNWFGCTRCYRVPCECVERKIAKLTKTL